MPVTLSSIEGLAQQAGQNGTGVYMLTGTAEEVGQSGQPHLQLTLEDSTGRAKGFVWPETRQSIARPATPAPVSVTAITQTFHGMAQLNVRGLAALDADAVDSASALLPRRHCPSTALPALQRLTRLEADLPAPLDGFLRRVLLDPSLGLPFLRCRASVRHHHAYAGGLLVHCTEMLDFAAGLTRQVLPADPWSPYLAQVGYLLHDLGKLISVGATRRARHGIVYPHAFMTIELLTPHLDWLEQHHPDLAVALRHLFAYLATPARARAIPSHVVAEIVERLDQFSAAAFNQRDLPHLVNPRGPAGRPDTVPPLRAVPDMAPRR